MTRPVVGAAFADLGEGRRTPLDLPRIVWQRIVDLADGTVLGHEALARFSGRTPADAFAQARRHGLVPALDRHCVVRAVAECPPGGLVFLNVTAETLRSRRWPDVPAALARRVVWELPETAGWDASLIPPGVAVALDDVGAGFAELVRLAAVPWRYVKADRSLAAGIAADALRQRIVRDLVARARDRGGAVIAEGVEEAADAECLAALGVRYGQGYFWHRPAPLAEPALAGG